LSHNSYSQIVAARLLRIPVVTAMDFEHQPANHLAFRLAFVRNYCRDREPLPFVMDDVLVNFDEQRASDTIEVLLDLSREVQIIFLTCHAKTVDMVRHHAPLCTMIDMGASVLNEARAML